METIMPPSEAAAAAAATEDKTVAVLCYITLIGFIAAIFMHQNQKTQLGAFHLRQVLGMVLTAAAGSVCGVVPILGWIVWFFVVRSAVRVLDHGPDLGRAGRDAAGAAARRALPAVVRGRLRLTMKKLAIGCGVLLLLGMVGAGGASYYAYHKVSSAFAGFAELGSLPQIERSVKNQRPFEPPPAGEPSQAQIERLLEIQGNVRARLGARADEIEHRYRRLLAKDSVTAVDVPELVSAYRDLAAAYMDGKRAQVDALNRAGLSLE